MFAIGHFALGYLTGKGVSKLLGVKINLPLLLVASVLPDIDLILEYLEPSLLMHRGPPHSIITFTVLMVPFFIKYRKQAIPYYVALMSHSLLGDLFTGGFQMLWPLSQDWYAVLNTSVRSVPSIVVEMMLFTIAVVAMYKLQDLQALFEPGNHNLVLFLAFGATLGPLLELNQGFESSIPAPLIPMSVFWITLFIYSMLLELCAKYKLVFLSRVHE
jgi:membrane-bound metal-dependent hydrolase YbcI (DUF457 family)